MAVNFEQIINEILTNLDINCAELARRIGVSPSTVTRLATGKTKTPELETGLELIKMHKQAKRKAA